MHFMMTKVSCIHFLGSVDLQGPLILFQWHLIQQPLGVRILETDVFKFCLFKLSYLRNYAVYFVEICVVYIVVKMICVSIVLYLHGLHGITSVGTQLHMCAYVYIHHVQKKGAAIFVPLTLPIVDQYSKFFHRQTELQISSSAIVK